MLKRPCIGRRQSSFHSSGNANMHGYRAFPNFPNPRSLRRLSAEDFAMLQKSEMQQSPSIAPGHRSSTVWYVGGDENRYFVLQVDLEKHPSVMLETLCTFTPTMGIDAVDGMLIEDAEHRVLNETLGYSTSRLDIYGSAAEVDPFKYLTSRGVTFQRKAHQKMWWQFWR